MNYVEVQAQVAQWMNRSDLTDMIPDFIALTEERMNRDLRTRSMETNLTETAIVDGAITPASDVLDVKLIWPTGSDSNPIKAQSLEAVVASDDSATPTVYAWRGSDLVFDGGGSVEGVLYTRIPALATAATNWVSQNAASLYLFGALAEAKLYVGDDAGAQTWIARFLDGVDQLNGNDNRKAGPLVARAR